MISIVATRPGCAATHHDTVSAYQKYGCRCAPAREATRLYTKRLRENRQPRLLTDGLGTSRRLKALVAFGHSLPAISARAGIHPNQLSKLIHRHHPEVRVATAAVVDRVYRELSATPGVSVKARRYAARMGWVTPWAWDDVDRDPEPALAATVGGELDEDDVDEVSVQRCATGSYRADQHTLTRAEKHRVVDLLLRDGRSYREIQAITGIHQQFTLRRKRAVVQQAAAVGVAA